MNPWHDINDERIKEDEFLCIIEIPKGSSKKYELDKETGLITLDRILYTATHYPMNYGFIPRTLSEDNDPLDVLVICSQTLDTMTSVVCFPIGVVVMIDNDERDEKILAIPLKDPVYLGYRDVSTLPTHLVNEISHFFEVYKNLEHSVTSVKSVESREEAKKVIREAKLAYRDKFIRSNDEEW